MSNLRLIVYIVLFITGVNGQPTSKLKIQLELFFELTPQDSVISLTQVAKDTLRVQSMNLASKDTLQSLKYVPVNILEKLKQQAQKEALPYEVKPFVSPLAPIAPIASIAENSAKSEIEPANEPSSKSETPEMLKKNKFKYVSYQTIFSSYTYGLALPLALDINSDKASAFGLLAVPVSFASHYYFGRNKSFYQSHLLGTNYFSSNSLIYSYGLGFILRGTSESNSGFRVGSFIAIGAYPVALRYGYKHGNKFQNEPGRINLQSSFAYTAGAMGLLSIGFWNDWVDDEETKLRLWLSEVLLLGTLGHYSAYFYRKNEKVTEGIGPGISTFAFFGFAIGIGTVISGDIDQSAVGSSILTASTGLGFAMGLWYFRDKQDTFGRSLYSSLGAVGGALTPLGVSILVGADPNPDATVWLMTAGGMAGYALTRWITSEMVEAPALTTQPGKSLSLNLFPVVIPRPYRVGEKQSLDYNFIIPGIIAKF